MTMGRRSGGDVNSYQEYGCASQECRAQPDRRAGIKVMEQMRELKFCSCTNLFA